MKIIDLLNKIANSEEVPTKIKYAGIIWEYDNTTKDYIADDMLLIYKMNSFALNKSFEILEEPKKIEKLTRGENNPLSCSNRQLRADIDTLLDKLNETIDYINKGDNNE